MLYEWPGKCGSWNTDRTRRRHGRRELHLSEDLFLPARGTWRIQEHQGGKEESEEEYVRNLLQITKGNVSTAAKLAGHQRIASTI